MSTNRINEQSQYWEPIKKSKKFNFKNIFLVAIILAMLYILIQHSINTIISKQNEMILNQINLNFKDQELQIKEIKLNIKQLEHNSQLQDETILNLKIQIQQQSESTNKQIKESKELCENRILVATDNVFKIIKEKGIETSVLKIGKWSIRPEQPNDRYLVSRHEDPNKEYDTRIAMDGHAYVTLQ